MVKFPARRKRRQKTKILPDLNHKLAATKKYFVANKFILIGLGVILGLLLIAEIYQNLRFSIWDGYSQLNLAVEQGNKISYIKINKQLEEVVVLTFADNVMIDLAQGYQNYPAGKVKALASQEKIHLGKLLAQSQTQFLGSVTDGYIVGSSKQDLGIGGLAWQALTKRAKTNLSNWDLIRLMIMTNNTGNEKIKTIDLTQTSAFSLVTLPDENQVYMANWGELDKLVLKQLARPEFLDQNLRWEIYNGTTHSGLGAKIKRIIANSGFDVVGVRQAQEDYERSMIIINNDEVDDKQIKKLARVFNFPIKKENNTGQSAADVTLIIGEDFWQDYFISN